jgi:hypothetical protein
MQKLIFIITAGAFIYLASYSYGKQVSSVWVHPKHVVVWKTHKAAVIASIYGLTPDDVAKPVELWK